MDKKKILYVRDSNDPFLKGFCRELGEQMIIYVLDLKQGVFINQTANTVTRLSGWGSVRNRYVNYIQRFYSAIIFLLKIDFREINYFHILNLKRENFLLIPFIKNKSSKVIVSVYGRSTYTNIIKRKFFSLVFKYIDAFTFTNESTLNEFWRVNYKVDKKKLHLIMLPLINLVEFKNSEEKKEEFVRKYKISREKIRISCSSTASAYDQHFAVIDSLKSIKEKDNVQLLFLLTYGGTDDERSRIIKYIHQNLNGFDYVIFDRFLTNEELIIYRELTSIYINMRRTDQIAAAILESLFKGSLLISPSWIDYSMLTKLGVKIFEIRGFEELASKIDELVCNFTLLESEYVQSNSSIISEQYGLQAVLKKWEMFYRSF